MAAKSDSSLRDQRAAPAPARARAVEAAIAPSAAPSGDRRKIMVQLTADADNVANDVLARARADGGRDVTYSTVVDVALREFGARSPDEITKALLSYPEALRARPGRKP